ncbi:TfoX/Sxy family DNA transformation protein [Vallitalea sp.]|jgi:nucleotidyltransferase/DNA polymerase involved in DNA repair|nr:TfoX/Sxy family DNA transformation protein [Vallitalea sp.]MCT4688341.1 helix-hairpin-helix domain-containing protein [Vallitalea sp.]
MRLSELPNIGKTLEKELTDIGIQTAEELKGKYDQLKK